MVFQWFTFLAVLKRLAALQLSCTGPDTVITFVLVFAFIKIFDANFSDPLTIKKSHCETFNSPEQVELSFAIVFFSSPPSH